MKKEKEEPKEIKVIDPLVNMIIPECCVNNYESCPHCIKKPKKVKVNPGL